MKEPILAIVIGFVIGLVITFGIWTANKSLKQAQNPTAEVTPTISSSPSAAPISATPSPQASKDLLITTPDNEAVFNVTTTKLTGTTLSGNVVVISGGPNEQILQADTNGQFTTDIDLESGYNQIKVTAYDSTGNPQTKTLTLTYTTTKI